MYVRWILFRHENATDFIARLVYNLKYGFGLDFHYKTVAGEKVACFEMVSADPNLLSVRLYPGAYASKRGALLVAACCCSGHTQTQHTQLGGCCVCLMGFFWFYFSCACGHICSVRRVAFGYGSTPCKVGVEMLIQALERYVGCTPNNTLEIQKLDLPNGGFQLVRCSHFPLMQECIRWMRLMITDIAKEHYHAALALLIRLWFCDFHDIQGQWFVLHCVKVWLAARIRSLACRVSACMSAHWLTWRPLLSRRKLCVLRARVCVCVCVCVCACSLAKGAS